MTPTPTPTQAIDRLIRDPAARIHFVGIGGTGMSALAHGRAMMGGTTSGSDRDFDRNPDSAERRRCQKLGIAVYTQDGSGVPNAAALVYSTAVETSIPDMARAVDLGTPLIHRSAWLAAWVRSRRTVAITGTSGKSTTVAMTFEALRGAGMDPGVISGGDLRCLQLDGARGNVHVGTGPLVIESDESDSSCTEYEPAITVILNLQRDHHDEATLLRVFCECVARTRQRVLVSADPALDPLREGAITFGNQAVSSLAATSVECLADRSRFFFAGVRVDLPLPGAHNVDNAVAALAVVATLGGDLRKAAEALAHFRGVARRFEVLGRRGELEVVDDFAHNAAKISAAVKTAQLRSPRVVAFWQPHGFKPTRDFRRDLVEAFATTIRPSDIVVLPEIYYAGGQATRDISSADLCNDLIAKGIDARFLAQRDAIVETVRSLPEGPACILLMAARDPSFRSFAEGVAKELTTA